MNNRQLLVGGLLPALVSAAIIAGLASACSDEAEEDRSAGEIAVVSPTIPFVTPPAWDCVGTLPPGWMTPASSTGSGCVLLPTPGCPAVSISGQDVCLPDGASYGGLGPPLCTEAEPCEPASVYTVAYGSSMIRWQTLPQKDGGQTLELVEWEVLPEHEDEFADLRVAFEAAGQDVP